MTTPSTIDPFARFRLVTRARIGIGRSGDAQPTQALLDFQSAHSRARDAVHGAVDFTALSAQLAVPSLQIRSQAGDRQIYLRRPDLGRRVHADDVAALQASSGDYALAIVIADGLSAAAVSTHAAPLLQELLSRLQGVKLAPVVLASQARVALGDEAAALLGARMVAVLIGERPGLSVADSLGVYLTWAPRVGRNDAERNCLSNIHADGQGYAQAAATLTWLMDEARRRCLTGVELKLDAPAALTTEIPPSGGQLGASAS